MSTLRHAAGIAFVAAAAAIGVQIASGAGYPVVPPGAIILLVVAASATGGAGGGQFSAWSPAPPGKV